MLVVGAGMMPGHGARAFDVVLNAQGEYLDAYLTEDLRDGDGNLTTAAGRYAFVTPNDPAHGGRHLNGKTCFFPPGYGHDGQFVTSDDTFDEVCIDPVLHNQTPPARCDPANADYVGNDPPGWAVMNADGSWSHRVIHAAGCGPGGQGAACDLEGVSPTNPGSFGEVGGPMATQGTIDPQGCFFDENGNLWGTDVGHDGDPTDHDGSLLVFFAASDYHDYCFVDRALFSPAMPSYDSQSRTIYLSESGAGRISKYTVPFPTSQADCALLPDHTVTSPAVKSPFGVFPLDATATPAAIVAKPSSDHFYLASVLLPAAVVDLDAHGIFSAFVVAPSLPNLSLGGTQILPPVGKGMSPEGVDVGGDGTIYFSDLNLQTDPAAGRFFATGCGRMWKAAPGSPPVLLAHHLRFPDGVKVTDSAQLDLSNLSAASDSTFCPSE